MGTWMIAIVTAFFGLVTAPVYAEEEDSLVCKIPPTWTIDGNNASRLGDLHDTLSSRGLTNISYIVVNDKSSASRRMYSQLKQKAGTEIPVYQQILSEPDVWKVLRGNKDDFLIYNRCGQLTYHLVMPYSFLHFPYVEAAILETYYKDKCGNCSVENETDIMQAKNETSPCVTDDNVGTDEERPHHHHHPHEGHAHGRSSSQSCGQKHNSKKTTDDASMNDGTEEYHQHDHHHSQNGHSHGGSSNPHLYYQRSAKKDGPRHTAQQQRVFQRATQ